MESRGRRYVEQVAEVFIARLKDGTAPWVKPWAPGEGPDRPINAATGKPYRGMNSLYLSMVSPNDDPRWCTMKQANGLGGRVRKGEHGQLVRFWKFRDRQLVRDEGGAPVVDAEGKRQYREVDLERPKAFHAFVWHASQIDGLEAYRAAPAPERAWEPAEEVQKLMDASGVPIHHDQRDRAFYMPSKDEIHLPKQGQFATREAYYATALHELGHSTGHETRLDRRFGTYGDEDYAREELRAEIASYMLGTELGVGHDGSQSASYVASWIAKLEDDPQEVYGACRDADRIVWFLRELTRDREQSVERTRDREATLADSGSRTLDVRFADNGEVRALGGKWDRKARVWFVPEGTDLEPFAKWLPGQARERPEAAREVGRAGSAPALAESKTRLEVPYAEKDEAKRQGARWDRHARVWYAPEGTDLAPLKKWMPGPERGASRAAETSTHDVVGEFAAFLEENGLALDGPPLMDGQRHRVPVEGGRPGATDGAYVGYLDGRPAGYAKNWKTGEERRWSARREVSRGAAQALRADVAERQKERRMAREAGYEEAAARAARAYAGLAPATATHPYLAKKGLDAVVRERTSFGARVGEKGELVVPLADGEGKVWTLQSIGETGFKHLMKGGRASGCFHVIGSLEEENVRRPDREDPTVPREYPDPEAELREVWVTTGFGTGAVVHAATGQPVVCAISDANLGQVAEAMGERFPDHRVVVLGDDDRHQETNSGRSKAERAAAAANGIAVFPLFGPRETGKEFTDFADVARARAEDSAREGDGQVHWPGGFRMVRRQIEQGIGRAYRAEQAAEREAARVARLPEKEAEQAAAPLKERVAARASKSQEVREAGDRDGRDGSLDWDGDWKSAGVEDGQLVVDGERAPGNGWSGAALPDVMHDIAPPQDAVLGNGGGREGAATQEARRTPARSAEAGKGKVNRLVRRLGGNRSRGGVER